MIKQKKATANGKERYKDEMVNVSDKAEYGQNGQEANEERENEQNGQ